MIETVTIPSGDAFLVEGDTISEIVVESADFPDLTTSTINLQVYYSNRKLIDVTNGSGITVNSATQFIIDEIPSSENYLRAGDNIGDLDITDSNGVKKTYFRLKFHLEKQYKE